MKNSVMSLLLQPPCREAGERTVLRLPRLTQRYRSRPCILAGAPGEGKGQRKQLLKAGGYKQEVEGPHCRLGLLSVVPKARRYLVSGIYLHILLTLGTCSRTFYTVPTCRSGTRQHLSFLCSLGGTCRNSSSGSKNQSCLYCLYRSRRIPTVSTYLPTTFIFSDKCQVASYCRMHIFVLLGHQLGVS